VAEQRRGTVSAFDGPPAEAREASNIAEEAATVGAWLRDRIAEGMEPEEIGVFVRSSAELPRASAAIAAAGQRPEQLTASPVLGRGAISMGMMHQAKGLEFRAVAVIAVDEAIVPLESRIESVSDEADLDEVYTTERHLLYVACTRARDRLLVAGVRPVSEFMDDLRPVRGEI
jgi:ATP-dependent exoDNAse (exonuclease V) beta subunit